MMGLLRWLFGDQEPKHIHSWTEWQKTDRLVHPRTKGAVADCLTRKCQLCGMIEHHAAYYDN
jgi:hypothetical protein